MPELNAEEQGMYSLLPLLPVAQEEIYKKKIDDLVARRQEAETAEQKLRDERDRLEKVQAESGLAVAQHTEQFNREKAEHDASANESAARLKLLEQTRVALDKRKAELDRHEHDLANRESELEVKEADVAKREEDLSVHTAATLKLEDELNAKHDELLRIVSR